MSSSREKTCPGRAASVRSRPSSVAVSTISFPSQKTRHRSRSISIFAWRRRRGEPGPEAPPPAEEGAADAGAAARRGGGGRRAAQHGAHPGDELPRAEGLRDVVISAELETDDAVDLVVFRRQEDDGDA